MSKVVLVVIVLLLCCCVVGIGGGALIGNFELNGECVYRGPFASNSGNACDQAVLPNGRDDTLDGINPSANVQAYNGIKSNLYTFDYPVNFTVDDTSSILFVYAENRSDNLNILRQNTKITVSQDNCEIYADETIDSLFEYDAQMLGTSTTKIGGLEACKVDFAADYGNGLINQTQYYVYADPYTYILTISINEDEANFTALDRAAKSFEVRTFTE